mmetsp:Transcript_9386/g.14303  ORF Transcript_9386/g.14303 Transcript_9386/m.14303 type:complete len:155 (+) Transcript_9386:941-1405(+)
MLRKIHFAQPSIKLSDLRRHELKTNKLKKMVSDGSKRQSLAQAARDIILSQELKSNIKNQKMIKLFQSKPAAGSSATKQHPERLIRSQGSAPRPVKNPSRYEIQPVTTQAGEAAVQTLQDDNASNQLVLQSSPDVNDPLTSRNPKMEETIATRN